MDLRAFAVLFLGGMFCWIDQTWHGRHASPWTPTVYSCLVAEAKTVQRKVLLLLATGKQTCFCLKSVSTNIMHIYAHNKHDSATIQLKLAMHETWGWLTLNITYVQIEKLAFGCFKSPGGHWQLALLQLKLAHVLKDQLMTTERITSSSKCPVFFQLGGYMSSLTNLKCKQNWLVFQAKLFTWNNSWLEAEQLPSALETGYSGLQCLFRALGRCNPVVWSTATGYDQAIFTTGFLGRLT